MIVLIVSLGIYGPWEEEGGSAQGLRGEGNIMAVGVLGGDACLAIKSGVGEKTKYRGEDVIKED